MVDGRQSDTDESKGSEHSANISAAIKHFASNDKGRAVSKGKADKIRKSKGCSRP